MKMLRETADVSPGLKESFTATLREPIELLETVFSRLKWGDNTFKVNYRIN